MDFDDDPFYVDDEPGYSRKEREYAQLAHDGILELLRREHAAVWLEIEAKLGDRPQPLPARWGINPHHLTNARQELLANGLTEEVSASTKGGRVIPVFTLPPGRGRLTTVDRVARRKRLLHNRYMSWAGGTSVIPNLIGRGGEAVVRGAIRRASATGICVPVNGAVTDVTTLFDRPVQGGSLDAAALYPILNQASAELTTAVVVVEVKNLRPQIYPWAAELYQLLDKAARLQIQHPTLPSCQSWFAGGRNNLPFGWPSISDSS